jgi:hypothetical protein
MGSETSVPDVYSPNGPVHAAAANKVWSVHTRPLALGLDDEVRLTAFPRGIKKKLLLVVVNECKVDTLSQLLK